eukprot:gene38285-51706_t
MLNQQQQDSLNAVPFPPNQWNRSHRINEKIGHIRSEVTGCQYRAYPNRLLHNTNSNRKVYVGEMKTVAGQPVNVIIKICLSKSLQHRDNPFTEDPEQESAAMQSLHPGNIPPYYPLQDIMHQIECCRTEDLYSIMPYCKLGDVIDLIMDKGAMNNSAAKNMMKQLLDGLEFLQSHGIGHRDMSPENVVMDVMPNTSNSVKFVITDFGMAVKCPPRTDVVDGGNSPLTAASHQRIPHKDVGKLPYNAPEIFLGVPFVNPMLSDMWSL